MSGCRSHGDLIGPYVLGGLEPAEAEEMTRHLAECDRCAAERRRLATLPALLDRAHAEDTVATLSPQLEDAVLDRFVRLVDMRSVRNFWILVRLTIHFFAGVWVRPHIA